MGQKLFNMPLITPLARWLSKLTLKLCGWKTVGEIPSHVTKCVVVGGPHTSNWDFPVFLMTAFALKINAHWMGKNTLFRFPFRAVMTWLGGIPINRQIRGDMVNKAADMFLANERLVIGVSPEGTRRATSQWHTGFWHIAKKAKVPIILAFVDYKLKQCGIYDEFVPTDDVDADMLRIKEIFTKFEGRRPKNFST